MYILPTTELSCVDLVVSRAVSFVDREDPGDTYSVLLSIFVALNRARFFHHGEYL